MSGNQQERKLSRLETQIARLNRRVDKFTELAKSAGSNRRRKGAARRLRTYTRARATVKEEMKKIGRK